MTYQQVASLSKELIRNLAPVSPAGKRESGCPAGDAFDFQAAAVILNHAVGDRKTQPRAIADILGREERVEDLRQDLIGDPAAVVGHFDDDFAVVRRRW